MGHRSKYPRVAIVLLGFGCGQDDYANFSMPAKYVGTVDGADAVVGCVVGNSDAMTFFVAGGPTTYSSLTHWFDGTASWGTPTEITDWTWRLDIQFDQNAAGFPIGVHGSLKAPDGHVYTLSAKLLASNDHTIDGLYASTQDGCRSGAVVGNRGSAFAGVWCGNGGTKAPLSAAPLALTNGAIRADVSPPGPAHEIALTPITGQ